MVRYEIKKVFGTWGSKIAVLILAVVVAFNCWTATNAHGTSWINEKGEEETGPAAVAKLRAAKKEWEGYLDTERLTAALLENQRINATPEAQSNDYDQQDIAYGWKQGFSDIREVINSFMAVDFNTYDYWRVDSVRAQDLPGLYGHRVKLLKDWLYAPDTTAANHYSEPEKQWLVGQYEALEAPMYYRYYEGWEQVIENSPMITILCSMILGFLVAGIFANEFKWKADAVYFSTMLGRTSNTKAKIGAGVLLVTVIYWACILVYSLYTLCYLGFEGWNCPVQLNRWKCFYNVTFLEQFLLTVLGGYLGNLFCAFLAMWISAKTKTPVISVTIPFLLVFLPNFLQNYEGTLICDILGLLPDRLLQINYTMNYFDLYAVGSRVVGSIPLLFVLYCAITVLLLPVMYLEFRHKEIY